jgi:Flp pilus assembly protein TadD
MTAKTALRKSCFNIAFCGMVGFFLIPVLGHAAQPAAEVLVPALSKPAENPATDTFSPWQTAKQLLSQKKWNDAEIELRKQVAAYPHDADGYVLLATALRRTGKTKEAIQLLEENALMLSPNHRSAHETIGMLYLLERQPEMAHQHLLTLKRLCQQLQPKGQRRPCPEVRRLTQAIDAYSP